MPLAAGTHEFQIDYTALDYVHPDLQRFRYRLIGLDEHWTSALSRRQAFFTNIKPGHYRFEAFEQFVEGDARPLQPMLADEANRIGAEALLNAFRHARASRVEIRMSYSWREFSLRVSDDGIGIDKLILQQGHATGRWGIRGMRERAEKAGAWLAIRSGPDGGTEIELRARSSNAYAWTEGRLTRWRRRWMDSISR